MSSKLLSGFPLSVKKLPDLSERGLRSDRDRAACDSGTWCGRGEVHPHPLRVTQQVATRVPPPYPTKLWLLPDTLYK